MAKGAGDLRRPFFLAAILVALLVVGVELGMTAAIGGGSTVVSFEDAVRAGVSPFDLDDFEGAQGSKPSGAGIGYLALIDGMLLFTLALLGSSVIVPHRIYGRVQGMITFVFSLVLIIVSFVMALLALVKMLVMIALFVSAPFGTIAYLAIWGFFPVGDAALVLSLLLFLKIIAGVLLVVSQPKFLRVKGLVALFVVSILLQLILGFIHGFLPGVVVSIGDELWAIVTAVVALIWAIVTLIGSIPAIVHAIRATASVGD